MTSNLVILEYWYKLTHCWLNPGEMNNDFPVEDHKGYYRTFYSAAHEAKRLGLGKRLSDAEYESFQQRLGDSGHIIKRLAVVRIKNRRYFVGIDQPIPAKIKPRH